MEFLRVPLQRHNRLLEKLAERLRYIQMKYADRMRCARGCALCCQGLFDISLPDALRISNGFHALPEQTREEVVERAMAIQRKSAKELQDLSPPFFLDSISQGRIDEMVANIGDVRCPFLDKRDSCLIYEYRPIACLLEGIPMVDAQDGLFGDWCNFNFREGVSLEMAEDLRLDYYEIQEIEDGSTIFIPSVIAASAFFESLSLRGHPDPHNLEDSKTRRR